VNGQVRADAAHEQGLRLGSVPSERFTSAVVPDVPFALTSAHVANLHLIILFPCAHLIYPAGEYTCPAHLIYLVLPFPGVSGRTFPPCRPWRNLSIASLMPNGCRS
jgi:hypothetical protein